MKSYRLLAGALFLAACSQQQPGQAEAVADNGTVSNDAASATMAADNAGAVAGNGVGEDVSGNTGATSADPSHATVAGSLKTELVGAGTVDRAPITDVTLASRCTTDFVTAKGTITVNWAKVGNFAGEVAGDKATIPIDDGSGTHRFTMPNTATFRRVNGSMGLLADDCGGAM